MVACVVNYRKWKGFEKQQYCRDDGNVFGGREKPREKLQSE
jgi:hypothetical protein